MPFFGKEEPEPVSVHDRPLQCAVCRHDTFYRRQSQLPGRMATILDMEWTAPVCDCRR